MARVFSIRWLECSQSPSLSVQWIIAAKAEHFHVSLNTLRPGLLVLPLPLALGIVILLTEFVHEEECVMCPNHF